MKVRDLALYCLAVVMVGAALVAYGSRMPAAAPAAVMADQQAMMAVSLANLEAHRAAERRRPGEVPGQDRPRRGRDLDY